MRILVTGGTGYLGSHLVEALLARGDEVSVLSRAQSPPKRLLHVQDQLHFFAYSVKGVEDALALGPADALVHAAVRYGGSAADAATLVENNVRIPLSLALAAGNRIAKFMALGTGLPPTLSPYACSKAQFVEWLRTIPAQFLAPRVHVPLQHFFGPGDDPGKFITQLFRTCLEGGCLQLTSGEQSRDLLYVSDAVSGLLRILDRVHPGPGSLAEVPLGTGNPIKIKDFANMVHVATGNRAILEFGKVPPRSGEPEILTADTTVMHSLGWAPRRSTEEGILETIAQEKHFLKEA